MFKSAMKKVGRNKCQISSEHVEYMWELWSHKHGDLNMHMIGRYLLERQEFEQTRWLPDLKEV